VDAASENGDAPEPAGDSERRDTARSVFRRDVLLWPLRDGTLAGVLALAVLAALFSWRDGGADHEERYVNTILQLVIGAGVFVVLAQYARRIVKATVGGRPVPWGRDDADETTLWQNTSDMAGAVVVLLSPLGLFLIADTVWGFEWLVRWPAVVLLGLLAAVQFPLAVAAVVVKDDVVAAFPRTPLRMWRAEPAAARSACGAAAVFLGLTIASLYLATAFNHGVGPRDVIEDHSALRDAGRVGLFALRAVGLYAALLSFRMAGLLVRDVPKVREILT
jgi:hypothetical protein